MEDNASAWRSSSSCSSLTWKFPFSFEREGYEMGKGKVKVRVGPCMHGMHAWDKDRDWDLGLPLFPFRKRLSSVPFLHLRKR